MIQKPKGTYDVFDLQGRKVLYIEKLFATLMEKYHYEYMRTPIFEASELFHRGVGDSTDIVTKETYDFVDRGNRNMTLRPEGTAGAVRCFIENKLYGRSAMPVKCWYAGPMYRYERPQSGRYREFYQIGVEAFGSMDPMMDAEMISIPVNFYRLLGLKGIKVHLNSLGDKTSRQAYKKALLEYFEPHLNLLCEDCKARYQKNPLRILDCKVDHDLDIMKSAPKMQDYFNEESKAYYEAVKKCLDALEIEYTEDPNLVRGLDYYTHTVFEVEASVEGFGSQNVLCGGGRYDGLVETLDGPATPGVGFALGTERLLTALDYEKIDVLGDIGIDIYVIPMGEESKYYALGLANDLRMNGFIVDTDMMNRNIKGNFKQADRLQAKYVILIGTEEIESGVVTIKNNETKEEHKVVRENLIDFFDQKLEEEVEHEDE